MLSKTNILLWAFLIVKATLSLKFNISKIIPRCFCEGEFWTVEEFRGNADGFVDLFF